MPRVSVVVPFYNVQDCVDYCVKSLLDQTYRDYELVLVDDGSTDSTPEKLDAYSNEPNVVVLHKENGGLSDARNAGVAVSSGELISFVDGDDLVSPDYLDVLVGAFPEGVNALVTALPDIVQYSEVKSWQWRSAAPVEKESLARYEALLKVAYEEIQISGWAKLAPRSVYLRTPFPQGAYYEDVCTIVDVIASVDNVVALKAPIYGYVMRDDSIVHRKSASRKQADDYRQAIDKIVSDMNKSMVAPEAIVYHRSLHLTRLFTLLDVVTDRAYARHLQATIVRRVRSDLWVILRNQRAPLPMKCRFAALALLPGIYGSIFRFYEKRFKGIGK
ncbi:MAG: glycosyltransferase family 2 protein [Ancrocorticia sp.]